MKLGIRISSAIASLCFSLVSHATLATYNFTGSSLTSSDADTHSTAGTMNLGTGISVISSGSASGGNPLPALQFDKGTFGSLSAQNTANYVQFTLNAASGYVFNLSSLTFDFSDSGSGKTANWGVGIFIGNSTTADHNWTGSFTTPSGNGNSWQNNTIDLSAYQNDTSVTFRIYGWDNANVDMFFDNFNLNGTSISPVPEPMNYSLAAFGLVFIGGSAGRFYFRRKARTAEAV